MATKSVMVSGCFDLLHAGHVAFLEEAASLGELTVCLGADANIVRLKGRPPLFSEAERCYLIERLSCVHRAKVASGSGMLDFEPDLLSEKTDLFVVNEDGHTPGKEALCEKHGVEYRVLKRIPAKNFPARSSTDSKQRSELPFRVCLAGGWMDQPWVSSLAPGSVVVARLEANVSYRDRCGMATSSRKLAKRLWGQVAPVNDLETEAKLLFGAENPPGSQYVSGSQDALGLTLPGISKLSYNGDYWPEKIERITDPETAQWLESVLHLVHVGDRPDRYNPLLEQNPDPAIAQRLGLSGDAAWQAILERNASALGQALNETLESWSQLLPLTVNPPLMATRDELSKDAYGSCYSGCGGGYLMLISDIKPEQAVNLKINLPTL